MNRKKRKIFLIIFIIALIGLFLYLYLIGFFHWIPEEESGGRAYTEKRYSIEYQGNTYICDIQENLDWQRVLHPEKRGLSVVRVGWGDFWRHTYYSNCKENPDYIYNPFPGGSLIYFREDIDVFQESLIVYTYKDLSLEGPEFCLNDILQNEPIEISEESRNQGRVNQVIFSTYMKKNPLVEMDMSVFEYNGKYYLDLDLADVCNKYKNTYYPIPNELVEEIHEFYRIEFD